ncbi:MAG: flavin reductase family protein [Eubacteriales bacterium]
MSKIAWKGGALLAPLPAVLVTCRSGDRRNVLTVAWTGTVNTQPPKTYISLRKSRYSYDLIKESGVFAINLTTETMVRAVDFCGVRSGRDLDKFALCHLETEEASVIGVPLLADSPLSIECRVTGIQELGSHDLILADIVAVDVRQDLVDDSGRLALEKAGLLAYVHGEYYALGRKLGKFGYSVEKKKKRKPPKASGRK